MINNDNIKKLQNIIFIKIFTYPLSKVYSLIIKIRNILYDYKFIKTYSLPGHCISLGNISVGGTGKTPVIIEIVSTLLKYKQTPIILTRGYKSGITSKGIALLKNGYIYEKKNIKKNIYPDEAILQSKKLPNVIIIVAPNRYEAARWYMKKYKQQPSHWILDDGYQYRKIKKNLNLVLIDSSSTVEDSLIPYGLLREPFSNLNRADGIILSFKNNKNNPDLLKKRILSIKTIPFYQAEFTDEWPKQSVTQKLLPIYSFPAILVCGIAQPSIFIKNLKNLNINIIKTITLGDHQQITLEHLNNHNVSKYYIITTEKDLYRNPSVFMKCSAPVYISKLIVKIDVENIFKKHNILL